MANYQDILKHAQAGQLTEAELEEVLAQFRLGIRSHPDRSTLVMIVGEAVGIDPRGRTRKVRLDPRVAQGLVEPLLEATNDPWLIRNALDVLCNYLGQASRYADRIRYFVRPSDWDQDGDVRIVAISALGKLIAKQGTGEGLDELLAIAESPLDPQQDWAVRALAVGLGAKQLDLPDVRNRMRSDRALIERTLQRAREWRDRNQRRARGNIDGPAQGSQ